MTAVPAIRLNDGKAIPQVGLGVMKMPADETAALCTGAIDLGYRAIDTAPGYGNEAGVGAAVRASDVPVMVTTKLWNAHHGHDAGRLAFENSLATLGVDTIDLYLIHWPAPQRDLYVETWKLLVELRDEGRVRSIGVSNFLPEHLERIIDATGVVPVTNQIELHPYFQQAELRAFHAQNGITTTCWAPLGRARLLDEPVLTEIARKVGRSPAQVVLRWHVQLGLIVIPKASSRARQAENLALFDFSLDADDMARLAALDRPDGRYGPHPNDLN